MFHVNKLLSYRHNGEKEHKMVDTIELIKKHTQELDVDYNNDLKAILKMVAKGNFGDTVFINGARTSVHDLVLLEQELMYSTCDNEPHTHGVYIKYSDVESIVDIAGYYIFERKEHKMTDTIELIKRHTQELDEYMKKNGKYSFHRFSDGSIRYKASVFNDISRIEDACPVPIEPVKELEELKKITKINDVLVTINDFVAFEGRNAILGETSIKFYGISAEIKYTGIHSLKVDYDHDLKKIIQSVKDGNFGGLVNIEGHWIDTDYLDIMEKGVTFPVVVKKGKFMTAYFSYDSIDTIRDEDGFYIYRR